MAAEAVTEPLRVWRATYRGAKRWNYTPVAVVLAATIEEARGELYAQAEYLVEEVILSGENAEQAGVLLSEWVGDPG